MTTPNEPNKSKTIPLHIADQAVAACEAEIQKLREENARLKEKSACQTECLDAFDKKLREAEAKIERLLEAGDELLYWIGSYEWPERIITAWNAAKENKPNA